MTLDPDDYRDLLPKSHAFQAVIGAMVVVGITAAIILGLALHDTRGAVDMNEFLGEHPRMYLFITATVIALGCTLFALAARAWNAYKANRDWNRESE